jgi:hypothetical protein
VHWGLVIVGAIGILLGLRVRAPALIVATAVTVMVGAVAGGTGSLFAWHRLLSVLLLVVTLQCTYLLGLFLGIVLRRGMSREQ